MEPKENRFGPTNEFKNLTNDSQSPESLNSIIFTSKKGVWSNTDDLIVINWVKYHGASHWNECAKFINGRNARQIRERWLNVLDPKNSKKDWSKIELYIIFKAKSIGLKWSDIAKLLIGRSDNAVKNKYFSYLRSFALNQNNSSEKLNQSFSNKSSSFNSKTLMDYFDQALVYACKDIDSELTNKGILYDPTMNIQILESYLHYSNDCNNLSDKASNFDKTNKNSEASIPYVFSVDNTSVIAKFSEPQAKGENHLNNFNSNLDFSINLDQTIYDNFISEMNDLKNILGHNATTK